jgi:hypothetical protein
MGTDATPKGVPYYEAELSPRINSTEKLAPNRLTVPQAGTCQGTEQSDCELAGATNEYATPG